MNDCRVAEVAGVPALDDQVEVSRLPEEGLPGVQNSGLDVYPEDIWNERAVSEVWRGEAPAATGSCSPLTFPLTME